MSTRELIEGVRRRGVALSGEDGRLLVRPIEDLSTEVVDELRANRQAVLEALSEEVERRRTIEDAIDRLFSERPEFRERRVGQVACQLYFGGYLDGPVKDHEVAAVLHERSVVALA